MAQLLDGVPSCVQETASTLVYIGPTDERLITCLNSAGVGTEVLRITSGGGDGIVAVKASRLVGSLGLKLVVRGVCASSCGNYLVPAARALEVEPFSIIGLHGGPEEGDAYLKSVQDAVERQQRDAFPDVSAENVARGREMMRGVMAETLAEHAAFTHDHAVPETWYTLTDFPSPARDYGPQDFAVVDPGYLANHLPALRVDRFWFPATAEERRALSEQMPGAVLHFPTEAAK